MFFFNILNGFVDVIRMLFKLLNNALLFIIIKKNLNHKITFLELGLLRIRLTISISYT